MVPGPAARSLGPLARAAESRARYPEEVIMPEFILKFGKQYMLWSTVTDAPATFLCSRAELVAHYTEQHGTSGARDLPERIARADKTGNSGRGPYACSAADMIAQNRAGPREEHMPLAELLRAYQGPHSWTAYVRAYAGDHPRKGKQARADLERFLATRKQGSIIAPHAWKSDAAFDALSKALGGGR